MARDYEEYTRRGARIAAISVDPPEANAALVDKLALPFTVLSDPSGERAIKPYDVWHAERGIARPAIFVIAPDGREVYRYVGEDFMDRPDDRDVLAALDGLGLPPQAGAATGTIEHREPQPSARAMPLDTLATYLRAVQFAMTAMSERMRDARDREETQRTAAMAERFIKAQAATRNLKRSA